MFAQMMIARPSSVECPARPVGQGPVWLRETGDPARAEDSPLFPDARAVPVPGITRPIVAKIATGRDEFEQAFQLLSANYRARGYEEQSTKLFRFTSFHALADTITFVAKEGDRVVATVSLVPDTRALGLPMEAIYGEEIARLRREGRRLAEVTSLADRDLSILEFGRVFATLMRLVAQYHLRRGGDSWVITVNPRHRAYYQRMLGFVPLGSCRSYPTVQDHPAEALLLDPELMRRSAPRMHRELIEESLPTEALVAPRRPAAHAQYFGARSTLVDRRTIREILDGVAQGGGRPRWDEAGNPPAAAGTTRAEEAA